MTNVRQYTTSELEEHIRVLQAELDSRRKSATPTDVYVRAGCLEDKHRDQLDAFFDGVIRDVSITAMSTRGNPEFISGNVKNYCRKLGNLAGVREILGLTSTDYPTIEIPTANTSVPEAICKAYLRSRRDGGTGFTTKMTMVETGTYKGNPFGIVQKPNGARWVIGQVVAKLDKVVAVPMTRGTYRNVDKETKGQRMVCNIPVFDPQG